MKKKQVMALIGLGTILFSLIAVHGELIKSADDNDLNKYTNPDGVIPEKMSEKDDTHKYSPPEPVIPDLELDLED